MKEEKSEKCLFNKSINKKQKIEGNNEINKNNKRSLHV